MHSCQGADQYLRFHVDSALVRSRLRALLRPRRHDLPRRSESQGEAREGRELQRLLDDDGLRFISEVLWATALTALVFHEAAEDRTT